MQISTWNVNSLTVRLPQVLDWLADHPVDALCLQELKLTDDKFPHDAFKEAGYEAVTFGQKTYNGVAILSRHPMRDVVRNIPGHTDEQARVIAATMDTPAGELRLVNCYFVNGQAVAKAKLKSRFGEPLALGPTGRVPQGCYFVTSKHKDGFDSRYAAIGWICGPRILGVGRPIL